MARFLVLDARFPRSVNHCLHIASSRLAKVRAADAEHRGHSLTSLRALESWVIDEAGPHIDAGDLHQFLTHVVDETHAICNDIGRELFGYPAPEVGGLDRAVADSDACPTSSPCPSRARSRPPSTCGACSPGRALPDGWGIGYYPGGEPSATVLKEPAPAGRLDPLGAGEGLGAPRVVALRGAHPDRHLGRPVRRQHPALRPGLGTPRLALRPLRQPRRAAPAAPHPALRAGRLHRHRGGALRAAGAASPSGAGARSTRPTWRCCTAGSASSTSSAPSPRSSPTAATCWSTPTATPGPAASGSGRRCRPTASCGSPTRTWWSTWPRAGPRRAGGW